MRKILFISLSFVIAISGLAQSKKTVELLKSIEGQWQVDENNNLFYQSFVEVPGVSDTILFNRAASCASLYLPGEIKENYPNQFILSKEHTTAQFGSAFMESIEYVCLIKFECKDNKVRVTLTGEKVKIYISDPKIPSAIRSISSIYPIDEGSLQKNDDAKRFNDCHLKSLELMKNIKIYLEGAKKEAW